MNKKALFLSVTALIFSLFFIYSVLSYPSPLVFSYGTNIGLFVISSLISYYSLKIQKNWLTKSSLVINLFVTVSYILILAYGLLLFT